MPLFVHDRKTDETLILKTEYVCGVLMDDEGNTIVATIDTFHEIKEPADDVIDMLNRNKS